VPEASPADNGASYGPAYSAVDIEAARELTLESLRRLVQDEPTSEIGVEDLRQLLAEDAPGVESQALGFPTLPLFLRWVSTDSGVSVEVEDDQVTLTRRTL
jgi:hypothetical protein